ncbi:hypothetical protein AL755_20125 [Arthrobacter sp. ERGS1:01]|nr:hypothetical protein AL755_20125 [Arthrobacter sp. ERGS1:01]
MTLAPLNTKTGLPEMLTAAQAQKVGVMLHLFFARATDKELSEPTSTDDLVALIKMGIKAGDKAAAAAAAVAAPAPAVKMSGQVLFNAGSGSYDPVGARAKEIRDAETIRLHKEKYGDMTDAEIDLLHLADAAGI